jgi:hypothetical protein
MNGGDFYGWGAFYDDTYDSYHPEEAEERRQKAKTKAMLDARIEERRKYDKLNPLQQYQYNQQRYYEIVQRLEEFAFKYGWEKAEALRKMAEAYHQIRLPEIQTNNPNEPATGKQTTPSHHTDFSTGGFSSTEPSFNSAENYSCGNRLRSFPLMLSPSDLIQRGLFIIYKWEAAGSRNDDIHWSCINGLDNNFYSRKGDGSVIDRSTGLIWQRAGSDTELSWDGAFNYITDLNRNYFNGLNRWRLPTIDELSTLHGDYNYVDIDDLRGYYIEPYFSNLFDENQLVCWSSDTAVSGEHICRTERYNGAIEYVEVNIPAESAWVYNFSDDKLAEPHGEIAPAIKTDRHWVRAVCSLP